ARYPASNASPAPVVSSASIARAAARTSRSPWAASAPSAPSFVTTTAAGAGRGEPVDGESGAAAEPLAVGRECAIGTVLRDDDAGALGEREDRVVELVDARDAGGLGRVWQEDVGVAEQVAQ